MTIEFSCEHCGKLLSTTDDKAGRAARCPDCQESIQVPTINTEGYDLAGLQVPEDPRTASAGFPPADTGSAAAVSNCPMCGFAVSPRDSACPACGEPLTLEGKVRHARQLGEPVKLELGIALSRAWQLFKENMGLVIGTQLVGGLLIGAMFLPATGLFVGTMVLAEQGGDDEVPIVVALASGAAICGLIGFAGAIWLATGMSMVLLRVTRGEATGFGTLFEGGHYFWRAFGCSLLYFIIYSIANQMCVLPAYIFQIFFWPYLFLLIDEDSPNIQAFANAPKLTSKSILAQIGLILISVGLGILGILMLGIGLLFTMPFNSMLWCVAYDEMRGGPVGMEENALAAAS